jgi:hypothetical protein
MAVRVPFRLRKLAWLVSASLAATGTAVAAPAARVDFAIGGVTVTGADGRSRPVAKGLELQSGDRIVTADGRAQLRFTDGAYVSVQPNSDFSIREYRFDGKTDGTEKGIFGLVRGALRTVTGAIGRVNRSAYQIQTPTATIGIRGTGGLIQILPDGTTLVTGNSGVWSLGNQAGSVDVPAGKAAKAGPNQAIPPSESPEGPVLPPPQGVLETPTWPTQSDALTAMPISAPNSAPPFVTGESNVLVAGDNVTSAGLPASLFGPLDCGTPAGCEVAYATLVSSVGASTKFHANPGDVTLAGDASMTAFTDAAGVSRALTGMHVDGGSSGGVVTWGRWVGSATLGGTPWSGFQTLAYVTGLPSPIADITAMSGTFTFNLVGWTAPTDGLGNVGTVTGGQLIGTFGPSPTVAINNFSFNVAGNAYNMTTPTPVGISTAGPYAPFSAGGAQVQVTGSACASGCSAQVNGHFMGAGATHAGFAYSVATFGPAPVVGAAAFQR